MGFELPEGETLTGKVLVATPVLLDPKFSPDGHLHCRAQPGRRAGVRDESALGAKTLGEITKATDLPTGLQALPVFIGARLSRAVCSSLASAVVDNDEDVRCEIVTDPAKARVPDCVRLPVTRVGGKGSWSGVDRGCVESGSPACGIVGSAGAAGAVAGIYQRRSTLA